MSADSKATALGGCLTNDLGDLRRFSITLTSDIQQICLSRVTANAAPFRGK
jgi:hypothetical protein